MAVARVDRIVLSDMRDTRSLSAVPLDKRMQTQDATHIIRLLGLVGTDLEMYTLATEINKGGIIAKRLLTKKLEDIVSALSTFCSITVTTTAAASSTFNAGADINALADWMSSQETGNQVAKSIYPTTPGSVIVPNH